VALLCGLVRAGVVPPGGAAVFHWAFQPLEAKGYSVALPLALGASASDGSGAGGSPMEMVVSGRGYHPLQETPEENESEGEAARCAGGVRTRVS
jgi:hypothetical protein